MEFKHYTSSYTRDAIKALEDTIFNELIWDPIDLIVDDRLQIIGRGTIFVVDLDLNGFSTKRKELYDSLMHKMVRVNDGIYEVIGIEAAGIFEDEVKSKIGLNVRKMD